MVHTKAAQICINLSDLLQMSMQKAVHSILVSYVSLAVSVVSSNRHNELLKIAIILFSVRARLKEAFSRIPAFDFITCRQLLNFTLQIGGGLQTIMIV